MSEILNKKRDKCDFNLIETSDGNKDFFHSPDCRKCNPDSNSYNVPSPIREQAQADKEFRKRMKEIWGDKFNDD